MTIRSTTQSTTQIAAHAYGREAQAALRAAVRQCKTIGGRYDPLAPVTIVAPSPSSGYHIRRAFGRLPGGLVNVQVKPLQALLELIGSGALANQGRRPLADAFRYEAIRAAVEEDRSAFADLPIEDAVLRTLEQRFREFDECDEAMLAVIGGGGPLPRYLLERYRDFRQRTAQFYTNRDLAESAVAALDGQPSALNDIGSVIVYLPGELTAAQTRFLNALERHTELRIIVGLSGDAGAVDDRVLERWRLPQETARPELPYAQRIVQSPDAEEEVRSAIREMAAALQAEQPTPLHRTALLYRHAAPYARICAEQLSAAGIPWHGRNAQTLAQSIAGSVLAGLLGLMQRPAPKWSSELAPWLGAAPIRAADGGQAPTARWNQLARSANLHTGPQDWLVRLDRYRRHRADDLERLKQDADDERPGRLPWVRSEIAQIEALISFTTQLSGFLTELPAQALWSEYAARTREQLRLLLGDRNAFAGAIRAGSDDLQLARWDDVDALLTSLGALDELGNTTPTRFAAAAARGLTRQTGHHGRLGDGVYVGALQSALGMEWDVVYILGAAERALPPPGSEDPLLSDQLRAAAALPLSAERLRRERSDYLAALHAAEQRRLSYPRADVRAEQARLPSRWLLESATARQGGERVYASKIHEVDRAIVEVTASFEQAVTDQSQYSDLSEYDLGGLRRSANPAAHYLTDAAPLLGRGYEQFVSYRARSEQFESASRLTRWDGLIAAGAAASARQPHSAGALQDWATCPYRYFLGRVLRVEEREEPHEELRITPLDKGSLIHDILEQFFKDAPAQPQPGAAWSGNERKRLLETAEQHLTQAEAQGLTGRRLLWQHERQRILNDLQTWLEQDDQHRARHQVQQIAGELTFGSLEGSAGLVPLPLADGSTFQLRGRIDRVDRSAHGELLLVIDYKTGSEYPNRRDLEKDPVVGGRFLQLPIYAAAAQQLLAAGADGDLRSAYWYITERGSFAFNELTWEGANRTRFLSVVNLITEHIKRGRFPANPGPPHRRARGEHCAFCSFDAICPADRRRHWQQIRLDPQLADYVELSEGERPQAAES